MKIDVVDNGGQWTHREWRMLKALEMDSEIISNESSLEELEVDGLVLSGGAPRISDEDMSLGKTEEYLEKGEVPILGICVGAQFMAKYFGGSTGSAENPEYGKTSLKVIEKDDLFLDTPDEFIVWESHNDEIKELGPEMIRLASSESCPIQAFKHKAKRLYGVQFHPEVEHTEHGKKIFENFIDVCRDSKR
ncbi:MAG: GMP synthase subunit A [Candidatus Thermoplasmatota archaeon]